MNHLPIPTKASNLALEIPFLGSERYVTSSLNEQSFSEFPNAHGFQCAHERGWVEWRGSGKAMLEFYQSWLYFGLMAAFFHEPIPPEHFVDTSRYSGRKIVQTHMLTSLIKAQGGLPWLVKQKAACRCLRIAVNHCLFLDQPHIFTNGPDESELEILSSQILFSIKILINTLIPAFDMAIDIRLMRTQMKPWSEMLGREPPSATILTAHMVRNGWCPVRLHHMLTQFSYQSLYYLARTEPRGRKANHSACLNMGKCVGDSIPDDHFKPQHVCGISGPSEDLYPTVPSPMEVVERLIQQGKIPLMSWNGSKLNAIEAGPGVRYTAITHVWAEGLGWSKVTSSLLSSVTNAAQVTAKTTPC